MRAGRRTLPDAMSSLKQGRRWNAGRKGTPVLTVVQQGSSGEDRPGPLIDEIVREGARRMLAEALRAEVGAYIAAFAAERDESGRRLAVRNGHHQPREVLTSAGAVQVTVPRVGDRRTDPGTGERKRFSSAILPPWARSSGRLSSGRTLPGTCPAPAMSACGRTGST
jgi:predicted amidohydrolase